MGKINILRKAYDEAQQNLEQSFEIMHHLFRYKPKCKEIRNLENLIFGLKVLIESESDFQSSKQQKLNKEQATFFQKIKQSLKNNEEKAKVQKKEVTLEEHDIQILNSINESIHKQQILNLNDYIDEKIIDWNS